MFKKWLRLFMKKQLRLHSYIGNSLRLRLLHTTGIYFWFSFTAGMCQRSFCEVRNRSHNAKGICLVLQRSKRLENILRSLQLHLMRNSIAKCAVALLSTRSAFFAEQHVATGKQLKVIEKRNLFVWSQVI